MKVRTRLKWLSAIGLLLILICTVSARRFQPDLHVYPIISGSTMTIVPGVHLLGQLGPSAAYAIETKNGFVLFDSGLEADAAPVLAALNQLHLNVNSLQAIFLTHVHGDHCGGAAFLRAATSAKTYAGQRDASLIREGNSRDAVFSKFPMPNHQPHPTEVDVELKGGEQFDFGGVLVQALAAPGHTPGSTCYVVYRNGVRILIGGDVIMNYPPQPFGTYTTYLAPRYRGDPKEFVTTLRKLREIPPPDLVLPGHPNSNTGEHIPRFDLKTWNAMFDDAIDELQRLISRQVADGTNFLDGEPKKLIADLYYFGDFHGAAVYGFFENDRFFVVNAPGGPGLFDFLTEKMAQLNLPAASPAAILITACDDLEIAGLSELVERTQACVVASSAAVDALRSICPSDTEFCTELEFADRKWFAATMIPLQGRGTFPAAFAIRKSGKQILFPGKFAPVIDSETVAELQRELNEPPGDAKLYADSLGKLSGFRPDLCLPTVPHMAQSANLYGTSWRELIRSNHLALMRSR